MKTALVLEDVAETREWLAEVLRHAFPHVEVTGAGTLAAARQATKRRFYDLALVDLSLPDGSGLSFVEELKRDDQPTICVITTVSGDDASIVAALAAGAEGYLLKEHTSDVLASQLRQVSFGIPALSPLIAQRIMAHFRNTGPVGAEVQLTARETDVLTLIARGMRNNEVAGILDIAESTVAGYIKSIYRKLGISSRAEAAWHAARLGLSS